MNNRRWNRQRYNPVLDSIEIDLEDFRRLLGLGLRGFLFRRGFSSFLFGGCFTFLLDSGAGATAAGSSVFTFTSSLKAGNGEGSSAVKRDHVHAGRFRICKLEVDVTQYFVVVPVGKEV